MQMVMSNLISGWLTSLGKKKSWRLLDGLKNNRIIIMTAKQADK
jgi:hypothetical protein